MRIFCTGTSSAALIAASLMMSAPQAAAAAPKQKQPQVVEAPAPVVDPAQVDADLQAAEAAIRAGRFDIALLALNHAAGLAPNLDAIYLRRSGVLEKLAGPEASWAQLQAARPSPHFQGVAQQLFYAAADAEMYLRLASVDAPNRGRIEARILDLRKRQRRAEELAAAAGPAPPVAPVPVAPVPVSQPSSPPPPSPPSSPPPPSPPAASPASNSAADSVAESDSVPVTESAPVEDAAPVVEAPAAAPAAEITTTRCDDPPKPRLGLRVGGALLTSLGAGLFGVAVAGFVLGRGAEN
jgi:hypothetical protein